MRKIIAGFACSLDGYIEGPNGEFDWIPMNKEIDFAEEMKQYDAFFYGRKTYEAVVKMRSRVPASARHYVFSRSLHSVADGFILVREDIEHEIEKIRQGKGKDIAVFGGADFLTSLLNLKLVDQLSISLIPVLLGSGKPMIHALTHRMQLRLENTRTYSNGTLRLTYRVQKSRTKKKEATV